MRKSRSLIAVAAVSLVAVASFAATPAQRCLRARLIVIARLTTCELRAHGSAAVRGRAVNLDSCRATFEERWAAIDSPTPCEPAVTSGEIVTRVEDFIASLLAILIAPDPEPQPIFVTRETFTTGLNANGFYLARLSGADTICNQIAQASGNPLLEGRMFTAVMCGREDESGSYVGLRNRLPESPAGYVGTNGVGVANDREDLLDGSLDAPISYDQYGELLPDIDRNDVIPVWTGCSGSGESYDVHSQCSYGSNWSWVDPPTGLAGQVGWPDRTDGSWLDARLDSCGRDRHLYCVGVNR